MRAALAALVLLAIGCAGAPLRPGVALPDWVSEESVWVDPDPGSSLGWGSNMDTGARNLEKALLALGMQPGKSDDPRTLVVKLDMSSGLIDFTFSYKLLRGTRLLEDGAFIGNDQPCWHAMSSVGAKVGCVTQVILDRILASRSLAIDHQTASPHPQAPRAPAAPAKLELKGRLAVLDLRLLTTELTQDNARYFSDLVRTATLRHAPQMEVMTRENLTVLLQATGKDLANCEGECEVDTGRRIGADVIVSGELQKVGTRFKLTLRLHETHAGRLLAASQASGTTIDQLDDEASKATQQLFEGTR